MNNMIRSTLLLIALFHFPGNIALAQETDFGEPALKEENPQLQAIIAGPRDIPLGRTIILDASKSITKGETMEYRWYVGGRKEPISRSVEAVYTPERAGPISFRLVIRAHRDNAYYETETTQNITVFTRKIVLVADATIPKEKLSLHGEFARENGTFLLSLQPPSSTLPLRSTDELSSFLTSQKDAFENAETIILWFDGLTGLHGLLRLAQTEPEILAGIPKQSIVLITGRSISTLARTARGPFSVLKPERILITRKEAISPILSAKKSQTFFEELQERDMDVLLLDASTTGLRPWNALSTLVNYMLTHGVPSETVLLLLMLPVIATILTFLKQVIGITTFGLYTPSIIALSFMALGWHVGLLFFFFILGTSYLTRECMRHWRLLYIPKVAIILTVVSFSLLILLALGASFDITPSRGTIFILLIMSTLAESFLNLKIEEGWRAACLGIGETLLAALLCVALIQWPPFQSLILAYPETILITLFINAFLGQWTGLRLIEYFRFREVFHHLQEE